MIDPIGRLKLTAPPEIIKNIFDEDMFIWTEVDVPGRVLIDYTNEYIDIVDLDDDEDVYVYKATDANVTDFILDFDLEAINTWAGTGMIGIGLADGIGTMEDVVNGLFATLYHSGANDNRITITHMTSGTPVGGSNVTNLNDDTTYYGRLIRRGSYCWLGIYSDNIRETHVTGSPIEYRDTTPVAFTHFYPMSNFDSGGIAQAADARIHAVKLISAPDIDKYLRPDEAGTNTILSGIDTNVDSVIDRQAEVSDVVIYPVAEHAGTTVIADDGTSPAFYADTESGTATVVGTPNVHWSEDIDFEQAGTITVISIFAELRWEHKTSGGTAYSKVQMSRDGGANWVDMTDAIAETNVAYQNKTRIGVGRFVTTIAAGANQLEFRLISWEAGGATSSAKMRSDSYVRITTRKS